MQSKNVGGGGSWSYFHWSLLHILLLFLQKNVDHLSKLNVSTIELHFATRLKCQKNIEIHTTVHADFTQRGSRESEGLPVTVGAITDVGFLPPGFKSPHSREQEELFI